AIRTNEHGERKDCRRLGTTQPVVVDLWAWRPRRSTEPIGDHLGDRYLAKGALCGHHRSPPAGCGAAAAGGAGRIATHGTVQQERNLRPALRRSQGRRTSSSLPALAALREVRVAGALRQWPVRAEREPLSPRVDSFRTCWLPGVGRYTPSQRF